jgi:hypothetical protein
MAMLRQFARRTIIAAPPIARCANGHSAECVFFHQHCDSLHCCVLFLWQESKSNCSLTRAVVPRLLLAFLCCGPFIITRGLTCSFRASAWALSVDELHASTKDECDSSWRNVVGGTVERPHSDGVPLRVHRGTVMGDGQRGAAAVTEIELFCCSGCAVVGVRIVHPFIRLFPFLFLTGEIRRFHQLRGSFWPLLHTRMNRP